MKRLTLALTCLFLAIPCSARTIIVNSNGTGDYPTIQAAINDANNGDIIMLQAGTYTGGGNRDIDFGGKAITLQSEDGPGSCIIDCENNYGHRGFYFHSGEDANSIVSGFTIKRGRASIGIAGGPVGGGIYCSGSSPKIKDCIIISNGSYYPGSARGGGIYCTSNSSPKIINCTISDNYAYGSNAGDFGFLGDPAYGGGIYCSSDSHHCTIENCIITGNIAKGGNGFGLDSSGGNAYGGGIYGEVTVKNCTIYDNSAIGGVGYYVGGASYGGGICCSVDGDFTKIDNSILWSDTAIFGPEIFGNPSVSYSDVEGGYVGNGNIDTDPYFANISGGNYHLKSEAGRWDASSEVWVTDAMTSPCIDAGDPNSDWTSELWPHRKRINIGAYGGTPQASMSLSDTGNIADLNNDGVVDYNDVGLFTEKWTNDEILLAEDLNRDKFVDFIDFAIFALEWPETPEPICEPEIDYEISAECSELSYAMSSGLRFSVTVEGNYIHFEDTMVANCCSTERWLEMYISNNQITIYEHEWTMMPCFCICDFPTTATIGPLEPGTYILGVIEDYGGFIGSTTFDIGVSQ